ncbi:MAG: HU family DNA-binding protein [Bacteroidaceae bacterium]|nr:HU family DNA-binding protein [Bacteroidaceae bacterium]
MSRKILPAELVEIIARNEGITKKKSEAFMRAFFEVVEEGLRTDSFVKIKGFGTFKLVNVSERESVNISTGERFQISGHTKVSFLPDTAFKDLINRPFSHFETILIPDSTTQEELDAISEAPIEEAEEAPEAPEVVEVISESVATTTSSVTLESNTETPVFPNIAQTSEEDNVEETPIHLEEKEVESTEESLIEDVKIESLQSHETTLEATEVTEISPNNTMTPTPVEDTATIPQQPLEETVPTTECQQQLHISSTPIDSTENEMNSTDNNNKSKNSRTLMWGILWIISLIIAYLAGYHRIIPLDADFHNEEVTEVNVASVSTDTLQVATDTLATATDTLTTSSPINLLPAGADTLSVIRGIDKATAEKLAQGQPQVKVGSFLIIGTFRKHTMRSGDTLFKLARSVYGHKDYVKYIILYNQFPNPDNVYIGTEILLPQLVEKEECAG